MSLVHRLFNALSFANVATLSEFKNELEHHTPGTPAHASVKRDNNVIPFPLESRTLALAAAVLPKTRYKL